MSRTEGASTVTLDANKALIRHVFEDVIPAGDPTAMRDLVVADFLDHDPLPGQPAGAQGAEYVVSTMYGAHPDLRFTIDDLVAEGDRVTIRWTHRPDARPATQRSAGRAGGDRDLPDRGREDRGALGRLEAWVRARTMKRTAAQTSPLLAPANTYAAARSRTTEDRHRTATAASAWCRESA
jgi:predicted SnoaL-like aldol condensation-catalyzing enzyme